MTPAGTTALSAPFQPGFPLAIEQDPALYTDTQTGKARIVIAHDLKSITGAEPTLREHSSSE